MDRALETVALFALKLVHETEGQSPILRDDPIMDDYQWEVFQLLVRRGEVAAIQLKVATCVGLALTALGGVDKPMGRGAAAPGRGFRPGADAGADAGSAPGAQGLPERHSVTAQACPTRPCPTHARRLRSPAR